MRRSSTLLVGILPLALAPATIALGEQLPGRFYLLPLGTPPGSSTSGADYPILLSQGQTFTIAVYVDVPPMDAPWDVVVSEWLARVTVTLPCSVPCSSGGSITYVAGSAVVDELHAGSLTDNCPFGFGPEVAIEPGSCPSTSPSIEVFRTHDGSFCLPPEDYSLERYAGEFTFYVSPECCGHANITVAGELLGEYLPLRGGVWGWAIPASDDGLSRIPDLTGPCTPAFESNDYVGSGGTIPNTIPQSLTRTVNITNTGTITDVDLSVDVSHDTYGSLLVRLTHGAVVDLANPGTPNDTSNLSGSYTFDDEAATSLDAAALSAGTSIPAGSYRGDESLSALDGSDVQGDWTLRIQDLDAAGSAGSLQDWTLTITTGGEDSSVCTCSMYVDCVCQQVPVAFGNANCMGPTNGVNLDDILCCLQGFTNFSNCPYADIAGCVANGVISLDDILSVLAAFGGADPCNCP